MEWSLFVQLILSNPWLLLSWEFVSSCLCAMLVFKLTGQKVDFPAIRARIGHVILGAKAGKTFRERLAERVAGQPIEKKVEFKEAQ